MVLDRRNVLLWLDCFLKRSILIRSFLKIEMFSRSWRTIVEGGDAMLEQKTVQLPNDVAITIKHFL